MSVGAVPECCGGIPPYLDAQVDRQVRPDLPGAAQQRFPAVLVELQQYLVALQSPYEEVRCIPVNGEPAPSCVAVGECRFERIVGAYGPQAERRAGFYALFGPPAQAEAPVGKLDLGRRVRIVPCPLGSEPVGREVIREIEYGLLCHAGKRHRLRQGCCFPAPEMKPQVIAQDDLLQHRLASQKEILTGQIGVAEVEHPPVGRRRDGAVPDGLDIAAAVQDRVPGVTLVGAPQVFRAGDRHGVVAPRAAAAVYGVDDVIVIADFQPVLPFHALPFVVAQQREGFPRHAQPVVRDFAGQEFDRPWVEPVGFPRDIQFAGIFQHECVDRLGAVLDDRAVVGIGAFGFVGRGDADIRRPVGFPACRIISVCFAVAVEKFRGPERGSRPCGLLLEQVPDLPPVDQVFGAEQRVVGGPFR